MTTFLAVAAVLGSPLGVALGWWLNQLSARRAAEREVAHEEQRSKEAARAARIARLASTAADLMPVARYATNVPGSGGPSNLERALDEVERLMIEFHLAEDEELSVRASGLMLKGSAVLKAVVARDRAISSAAAVALAREKELDAAMEDLQGWAFDSRKHLAVPEIPED